MKVENLMTTQPSTCSETDHLAAATMRMWEDDCGILPVVDDGGPVGVITDRDIAMALGMRKATADQVKVGDVMTGQLFWCSPDDEVAEALGVMREHKVRRLPVVDKGRLVGLLSLNDIVLETSATAGSQKKPTYALVVKTLRAISEHRNLPVGV